MRAIVGIVVQTTQRRRVLMSEPRTQCEWCSGWFLPGVEWLEHREQCWRKQIGRQGAEKVAADWKRDHPEAPDAIRVRGEERISGGVEPKDKGKDRREIIRKVQRR